MGSPEAWLAETFGLTGRVALVTGATSGIGRHMALTLARAGASVVVAGRREQRLAEVAAGIAAIGGSAQVQAVDLGREESVVQLAAAAARPFGAPDVLVNAAGVNLRQAADDITWSSWRQTLDLNLSVPFFLARELVPGMREKGGGNIINIASLQSTRAFTNGIAYGASKGGVAQLTRAMAEAWSRDGIVTNAIVPGFFPTELTRAVFEDEDVSAHHARMTAVGRNGELRDLEGTTIFLASRAAAYVTGQLLPVDGGYTAK